MLLNAGRDGQLVVRLKPNQLRVFNNTRRFQSLIAGRRFGKTVLMVVWLIARALRRDRALCWYVAPTYKMARDIAWDVLLEVLPPGYLHRKPNESRLEVRLRNGSKIALHGAEHPRRLKGRGLDAVVCDEYPYMEREVWVEALLPSLADKEGDALLGGTPVGFNWGYETHMAAKRDPEWASWTFTTLDGGYVSPKEVERQRGLMDARTFQQEYNASFEALTGRVYDYFSDKSVPLGNLATITDPFEDFIRALLSGAPRNRLASPPPLYVGFDFNVNPMTYVAGLRGGVDSTELLVTDAGEVPTSNTEEVGKYLRAKYPERQLIACPDPSGKRRSTNAPLDYTDHSILRQQGFVVKAPKVAPRVVDRIAAVQTLIRDAAGRRRLLIDPQGGAPLIRALNGLTYREGMNIPDPKSPLIHITDALGYLVWSEFNLHTAQTRSVALSP